MPTITHLETAPYTLPLRKPLHWGVGHVMPRLDHMLVRVVLDNGAVGLAEVNPRPTIYGETQASVAAIIEDYIAPRLVGQPLATADDIPPLAGRYRLLKNNHSAQAGVDMALWDALATTEGKPLGEVLGAAQQQVRVSYLLGTGPAEDVLAEVGAAYQAGVRVFKVKVGKDLPGELATARQLHETYPDINFYLDANETLSTDDAPALLQAYADLGAWYCEEPLPVHLLQERAELRRISPLMLIGDDSCFTLRDVERELAFNTFDVLNIKPPRTGFTQGLEMLRRVRPAEKYVMVGSQASSILGCIYTLLFAAVPGVTEPSEGTFWLQVAAEGQLPIHEGYTTLDALHQAQVEVKSNLLSQHFPAAT